MAKVNVIVPPANVLLEIELSPVEAETLMVMMQNPRTSEESVEEANIRRVIFEALNGSSAS